MDTGARIRRLRGEKGLTQERLAELAKISPTTLVRIESGEISRPRIGTLAKIAAVLGVRADELRAGGAPERAASPGPFTAVFEHTADGWWVVSVPEIPGAHSQGRTLEEAREMIRDAVTMLLEVRREDAERETAGHDVIREPLAL